MLRSLREVQGDDGVVGFYIATHAGAFFSSTFLDMQTAHQERLRQGGVVVVHGGCPFALLRAPLISHLPLDTAQTKRGNAAFRAFRLTKSYLEAHKKGNFASPGFVSSVISFACY
jgi:translation initiation factor 3 subunit H